MLPALRWLETLLPSPASRGAHKGRSRRSTGGGRRRERHSGHRRLHAPDTRSGHRLAARVAPSRLASPWTAPAYVRRCIGVQTQPPQRREGEDCAVHTRKKQQGGGACGRYKRALATPQRREWPPRARWTRRCQYLRHVMNEKSHQLQNPADPRLSGGCGPKGQARASAGSEPGRVQGGFRIHFHGGWSRSSAPHRPGSWSTATIWLSQTPLQPLPSVNQKPATR